MSELSCPKCGGKMNVPAHYMGKIVKCGGCWTEFLAEEPPSEPPSCLPPLSDQPAAVAPTPADESKAPAKKRARRTAMGFSADNPDKATPRQLAIMKYWKIPGADNMTKGQAGETLDRLFEQTIPHSRPNMGKDYGLTGEWQEDCFLLFPAEYPDERRDFLCRSLRGYVRGKISGCSEKLTNEKIMSIVAEFDDSDPLWVLQEGFRAQFLDRLAERFPGCCDGKPATAPSSGAGRARQAKRGKQSSGCLSLLILLVVVPALCAVMLY